MNYFKNNNQKGLTLTEVIVATGIFSVLIVVLTGVFVNSLKSQRKVSGFQDVQENAQYIIEKISKEARMSKIVEPETNGNFSNYIVFKSRKEDGNVVDVRYEFDSDSDLVKRKEWDADGGDIDKDDENDVDWQKLNSEKVKIKESNFYVVNPATPGEAQPRVTIFMILSDLGEETELPIQTTISARTYGPTN